jgi:hypothetical protein
MAEQSHALGGKADQDLEKRSGKTRHPVLWSIARQKNEPLPNAGIHQPLSRSREQN